MFDIPLFGVCFIGIFLKLLMSEDYMLLQNKNIKYHYYHIIFPKTSFFFTFIIMVKLEGISHNRTKYYMSTC